MTNEIGIEVALLIASAYGKGIDVHVWFAAGESGFLEYSSFASKLNSLGLAVGFEEDWETKRELELATCKDSLKLVRKICGDRIEGYEQDVINVTLFLSLCDEKMRHYLQTLFSDQHVKMLPSDGKTKDQTINDIQTETSKSDNVSSIEHIQEEISSFTNPIPIRSEKTVTLDDITSNQQKLSSMKAEEWLQLQPEDSSNFEDLNITNNVPKQRSNKSYYASSPSHQSFISEKSKVVKLSINKLECLEKEVSESLTNFLKSATVCRELQTMLRSKPSSSTSTATRRPSSAGTTSRTNTKTWINAVDIQQYFQRVKFPLSHTRSLVLIQLLLKHAENFKNAQHHQEESVKNVSLSLNDKEELSFLSISSAAPQPQYEGSPTQFQRSFNHLPYRKPLRKEEDSGRKSFMQRDEQNRQTEEREYRSWLCRQPVVKDDNYVNSVWLSNYIQFIHSQQSLDHQHWVKLRSSNQQKQQKIITENEFQKALSGRNYDLCQEEIDKLLESYEVLSIELLEQEVNIQINHWVLDTSGRKDFQHKLNFEIQKWNIETKKLMKQNPELVNEAKPWKPWEKLTTIEKKKIVNPLKMKLIQNKRKELLESEEESAEITKFLFRNYQQEVKRSQSNNKRNQSKGGSSATTAALSGISFGDWLEKYIRKSNEQIEYLRKDRIARKLDEKVEVQLQQTVTPLINIQQRFEDIIKGFTTEPDLVNQLKKGLALLRKEALDAIHHNCMHLDDRHSKSLSSSMTVRKSVENKSLKSKIQGKRCKCCLKSNLTSEVLITREQFNNYFLPILSRNVMKLPEDIKQIVLEENQKFKLVEVIEDKIDQKRRELEQLESAAFSIEIDPMTLFTPSIEKATRVATVLKDKHDREFEEINQENISAEKQKKDEILRRSLRAQAREEKRERIRLRKAEKEYEKWVRLYDKSMYYSKTHKKKCDLPKYDPVYHESGWQSDG